MEWIIYLAALVTIVTGSFVIYDRFNKTTKK